MNPCSHAPPTARTKHEAKTGKSIVLIDDTDMLLLFVEDVLATENPSLRISTAPTGAAGVKAVTEILPDLVLSITAFPISTAMKSAVVFSKTSAPQKFRFS